MSLCRGAGSICLLRPAAQHAALLLPPATTTWRAATTTTAPWHAAPGGRHPAPCTHHPTATRCACSRASSSPAAAGGAPGPAPPSTASAATPSAPSSAPAPPAALLLAATERALQGLAALLVHEGGLAAGDVCCLYGDVGAGKSVFSRAFVRTAAGDPALTVPSPTYLLQNVYEAQDLAHSAAPIHHFDLYRLPSSSGSTSSTTSTTTATTNGGQGQGGGAAASLQRLNLRASFASAVSLVEWAERLHGSGCAPANHLAVHIEAIPQHMEPHFRALAAAGGSGQGAGAGAAEEGAAQAGPLGDDLGEGEEEDEDEDGPYSDRRWRRVRLEAHGGGWEQRLARVVARVQGGAVPGLRHLAADA